MTRTVVLLGAGASAGAGIPITTEMTKRMVSLSRQIQDKDAEVTKMVNDDASVIISQLYDDIKTVVDKTAEMNGYHIVFAYPDAVTKEELNSAMVKELKLKPPAAQPFYVARHVDLTGIVIQTLNAWNPAPPVPAEQPQPQPGAPGAPANPVNTGVPSTVPPGPAPGGAVPGPGRPPGM